MENNPTIPLRLPPSPQLLRCKSRSTNINSSDSSTKSLRTSSNSKRRENGQDTSVKSSNRTVHKKTEQDVSTGFVMFLPRSKSARTDVPRRNRSASTSPSAWALSPGRSSLLPGLVPRSPSWETLKPDLKRGRGGGGGGVSAVLKFFRPKKVFLVLEEEYHRFRVVHNRLLQWRFANARAEASMTAIKRVAQKKLLNAWIRISVTRNLIVEKRNEVVKLKHQLKLHEIMKSQMKYLTEWSRTEARNCEAVGRVVRKLSAISVCLPLVDGVEANNTLFNDAMTAAVEVMDSIEAMIVNKHRQIETTSYVLMELMVVLKQHKQYFEELEKGITIVTSLEAQENSLRVGFIQLGKEMTGTSQHL